MDELIIDPSEVSVPGVIVERVEWEWGGPQFRWWDVRVLARRTGGPLWEKVFSISPYGLEDAGNDGLAYIVSVIRGELTKLPEVPIA